MKTIFLGSVFSKHLVFYSRQIKVEKKGLEGRVNPINYLSTFEVMLYILLSLHQLWRTSAGQGPYHW